MEKIPINGEYFKGLMRDRKLSVRQLASLMGMNHHTQLSRLLSGDRRMQLDEVFTLSRLLGAPYEAVIANAGFPEIMKSGPRVAIVGVLGGDGTVDPVAKNTERAIAPAGLPDGAVAIQARSADTPLAWMDGFVFFVAKPTGISTSAAGRFCYAKVKSGPAVLATVRRGYSLGTFNLSGPYTASNAELDWAEPIIITRN